MSRTRRAVLWACSWAQEALALVEAWAEPPVPTEPSEPPLEPLQPMRPGSVLTPEAQAMIAVHERPTRPQPEPLLEGSAESRIGGRVIGRRT